VTLLDDIQTDATDRSVTLSDLLRKCQILAYRLRHEPFKEWVAHELTGYPDEAALPAYRGPLDGQVRAHLVGTFGREAKSIAVPITNFPKEMRDRVTEFRFYQGVGTLDALIADARRNDDPRVISPFPVEVAAAMPVWQGYQTISMWNELPVAAVAGILDQVRSRALEFVLEIEAENPEAGTAATAEPPVPLARTDAIFYTVIFGGNVAVGPGATVQVIQGDLGSLMAYLEAQGVSPEDRKELEAALAADRGKLGPRVRDWLGSLAVKATSSGGRIAESAVAGLAAAAIARFLGIG
jgi:hypothetical protein